MTGIPGDCLDCGQREQSTAFGLCGPCQRERRQRVRASIRAADVDEAAAGGPDDDAGPSGQARLGDFG